MYFKYFLKVFVFSKYFFNSILPITDKIKPNQNGCVRPNSLTAKKSFIVLLLMAAMKIVFITAPRETINAAS